MPVAFRVGAGLVAEGSSDGESSAERSRVPFDFLGAVLALAFLGLEAWDFSSSARSASRSAFLRAASAFFSASASLVEAGAGEDVIYGRGWIVVVLLLCVCFGAFRPFLVFCYGGFGVGCCLLLGCCFGFLSRHGNLAFGASVYCPGGAGEHTFAFPATFLVLSPLFLPPMMTRYVVMCTMTKIRMYGWIEYGGIQWLIREDPSK